MRGRKRLFIAAGCIVFTLLIAGGVYLARVVRYQDEVRSITITEPDLSNIPDGRYIGECDVGLIYAKVEAEVEAGTLKQVRILEHRNGRGGPAEQIVETMLQVQRIDVDAVSSATNSSKVIKKALERALTQTEGA